MADEYSIAKAFTAIENELMASMIRNMRRHKVEEVKEDRQWAMWQAMQLESLERYKQENQKKYGQQFKDLNQDIETLIRAAKTEGEMAQEIAILSAIKNGFPAQKVTAGSSAEFFRLNERKLEALIEATTNDMEKAETAILRMTNDQYRKVIYNAQVYANTGAGTYEKAVDMATKNFIAAGINCIEYRNGARHTLSDYAEMALRTASKRAYLQGEGTKRQEWGISTVIMNKRGNPCPKCLPFVGKILIDDVWSGGSSRDGPYPLMSDAIAAGLYHPNCRDSHTTYFPGISRSPDDRFSKKELEDIKERSKGEARQQYAKRQEEKFGRLVKHSLDEENRKGYALKEANWRKESHKYELTQWTENSKMTTKGENMSLEYQRYGRNKETVINSAYINSGEYKNKFDNITDNKKVSRVLYSKAKEMLHHRSGTKLEDMYWIDGNTGDIVASALNEQKESGVIYTDAINRKIQGKNNLIVMHTHPGSMPPSIEDFNSALEHGYKTSLVICHDGTIYEYTSEQEIQPSLQKLYIGEYIENGYTEKEAQLKGLEKIKRNYDINFWEVK